MNKKKIIRNSSALSREGKTTINYLNQEGIGHPVIPKNIHIVTKQNCPNRSELARL